MTSETCADELKRWLVEPAGSVGWVDQQDGAWAIASLVSNSALIDLFRTPDALPHRRDEVLYALAINLQIVLSPKSQRDPKLESERDLIIEFSRENWTDILRIDREMGLSGDFDAYVISFMTKTLSVPGHSAGMTSELEAQVECRSASLPMRFLRWMQSWFRPRK